MEMAASPASGCSVPGKWHNRMRFTLGAVVLPFVFNVFAYFGFLGNYFKQTFSKPSFLAVYETGIYRYRVLGRKLLLWVYEILVRLNYQSHNTRAVRFLDPAGNGRFYFAYFVLNTAFLCLTCAVLWRIYRLKIFRISEREKSLWMLVLLFYMVISEFVVVPYDLLSYFFLCLGMYLILWDGPAVYRMPALAGVMVAGALTRESAALILSFYATVAYLRDGFRIPRARLAEAGLLAAVYAGTYLLLRLVYGFNQAGYDFTFFQNLGPAGLYSLLFFGGTLGLFVHNRASWRSARVFLVCASPYILMVFLVGLMFEVRLWMPLILPLGILAGMASGPEPAARPDAQAASR